MHEGCVKIGDRKNKLTVIGMFRKSRRTYLRTRCDCGKEKDVRIDHFGDQQSCGCACVECGKRMVRNLDKYRTKHGLWHSDLYVVWAGIKRRCYKETEPAYYRYGGRGIKMCDEWLHSVSKFSEWAKENGYRKGLTIDRIDNDKGYSPSNCRLVTMKEQSNNRSSNKKITLEGETKNASEWADRFGIKRRVLYDRLSRGWPIKEALTKPIKTCCQRFRPHG